jgi:hypothetical protein
MQPEVSLLCSRKSALYPDSDELTLLETVATTGQMTDDGDCGATGGMKIGRGN